MSHDLATAGAGADVVTVVVGLVVEPVAVAEAVAEADDPGLPGPLAEAELLIAGQSAVTATAVNPRPMRAPEREVLLLITVFLSSGELSGAGRKCQVVRTTN